MTTVAHEDRVIAGNAMLVEPDVRLGSATDVRDVHVEWQQPPLVAVVERQVLTAEREPGLDRSLAVVVVEQREAVEHRLARVRVKRRGGVVSEGGAARRWRGRTERSWMRCLSRHVHSEPTVREQIVNAR